MKEQFPNRKPQGQHREDTRVQVSDLVMVDFRTANLTPDVESWKNTHAVPYAESCARQIWYGTQQDFADFPFSPAIKKLEGADAYNLMLRIASGYESKRICETHVRHQLYDGFRVFQAEHPDKAKDYQALMKMLKTDLKFVTDKITSQYKTRREEHSALDLVGQKKGEKILLIGGATRYGNATELTTEIAKVCESRQRPDRDFLTITHPNPNVLEAIQKDIRALQDQRIIRMQIDYVSFDDIAKAVENNDRVYNAMSMGSNPEAEALFIKAWQDRSRTDNSLVCFRGNPRLRGASSPEWSEAGLNNYVSPEDIRTEMLAREQMNNDVIERGSQAFQICGNLRSQGMHPRHDMSDDIAAKLQLNI